jgi:hypothetical protein
MKKYSLCFALMIGGAGALLATNAFCSSTASNQQNSFPLMYIADCFNNVLNPELMITTHFKGSDNADNDCTPSYSKLQAINVKQESYKQIYTLKAPSKPGVSCTYSIAAGLAQGKEITLTSSTTPSDIRVNFNSANFSLDCVVGKLCLVGTSGC